MLFLACRASVGQSSWRTDIVRCYLSKLDCKHGFFRGTSSVDRLSLVYILTAVLLCGASWVWLSITEHPIVEMGVHWRSTKGWSIRWSLISAFSWAESWEGSSLGKYPEAISFEVCPQLVLTGVLPKSGFQSSILASIGVHLVKLQGKVHIKGLVH